MSQDAIYSYSGGGRGGWLGLTVSQEKNQIAGGKDKMKKVLTIALVITLALVLVVGVALPGLAASEEATSQAEHKPWPRMLRGVVDSVDDENQEFFTVKVGERVIDIDVNEDTKYFMLTIPRRLLALRSPRMVSGQLEGQEGVALRVKPSPPRKLEGMEQAPPLRAQRAFRNPALLPVDDQALEPNLLPPGPPGGIPGQWQRFLKWLRQFGQEASFDDLTDGDRVVVWVVPGNGNPLAKLVLIIKSAAQQRVVGIIQDVDEDDMTITIEPVSDTGNSAIILDYDSHTIFILRGTPSLKEGMKAVVIYVETDNGPLAKRVMARVPPPEPAE